MRRFYFRLKDSETILADFEGEELPDEAAARAYGELLATELMVGRAVRTRSWRLQVCDDTFAPVCEVLFASVDRSISHLPPPILECIQTLSGKTASLTDAISEVRMSLRAMQATLAQANNTLHLAAVNGRRVDNRV